MSAPLRTAAFLRTARLFYAAVLAAAFGLRALLDGAAPLVLPGRAAPDAATAATHAALGFGIGTAIVGAAVLGAAVFRRVRDMEAAFRRLLGPLDRRTALELALYSGVAEELLFRGALQPLIGAVASCGLFAALHVGPERRLRWWWLTALAAGALFAYTTAVTGDVTAAVVAHVVVNAVNLARVGALPAEPTTD